MLLLACLGQLCNVVSAPLLAMFVYTRGDQFIVLLSLFMSLSVYQLQMKAPKPQRVRCLRWVSNVDWMFATCLATSVTNYSFTFKKRLHQLDLTTVYSSVGFGVHTFAISLHLKTLVMLSFPQVPDRPPFYGDE